MIDIEALVGRLRDRDDKSAYAAFLELQEESRRSNKVYPYFDRFASLIEEESSYARTRGLLLVAANARWDVDYKVDEIIDQCLVHVMDVKPTVSRQLIAALPELARYKGDLRSDIRRALERANPGRYRDSMAPLIQKDISKALREIDAL